MLPCPALSLKPLAGGLCVNLAQVYFYQAEGLLDEFMELVDSSQRVDADDAKGLFETRGKIVRGDVQM